MTLTDEEKKFMDSVVDAASRILGPDPQSIKTGGRIREYVRARHIVIHSLLGSGKFSRSQIASYFNNNAMTVTNATQTIRKKLDKQDDEAALIVTTVKKIMDAMATYLNLSSADISPPIEEPAKSQIAVIADKLSTTVESSKNQIIDRIMTVTENTRLHTTQQFRQSLEHHEQYIKALVKQLEASKKASPVDGELRQVLSQVRLALANKPDHIKPQEVRGPSVKGGVGKRSIGYVDAMTVPIYRCPVRTQDEDLMDKYGAWVSGYWVVRTNLMDQNWSISVKAILAAERENAAFIFIEPK